MENLIGKKFNQYQIIDRLGAGGMAEVYRARDTHLTRDVAIKVLPPELARDNEFVQRFQQEANTAAQLEHPNIIAIYDIGFQDGLYYIAMRLLHGQTLRDVIHTQGALPLRQTLHIFQQLANALDHAHQQGIIHRDIKPSNIMVGTNNYVTLMDFGIAKALAGSKLTKTGTMIGTPEYMAPEQFTGQVIDARSDVYAMGIVLYEMLTGKVPFTGETPVAVSHGHVYQPAPLPSRYNPQITPAIEQVILKALEKNPHARYQTTTEFANALAAALGQQGMPVPKPAVAPETGPVREKSGTLVLTQNLKLITAEGYEYPLEPGILTLGRTTENNVVLNEEQVSRKHAEIHSNKQGSAIIDLGSTNGTFINGQRITPHTPYALTPGERIYLGRNVALVVERGETREGATPPPPPVEPGRPETTLPGKRARRKPRQDRQRPHWPGIVIGIVVLFLIFGGGAQLMSLFSDPTATPAPTAVIVEKDTPQPAATVLVVITATPKPGTTPQPAQATVIVTATPKPAAPTTKPVPVNDKADFIAYACGSVGNSDICMLDVEANRTQKIVSQTANASEPDWSPDGQQIAFQSNKNGNYDIFVVDVESKSIRNLTNTPNYDERAPDWDPSGSMLVYEVGDGVDNGELWMTTSDGSNRQRVLDTTVRGRSPTWSPDGRYIAFMYKEDTGYWQIYILDVIEEEFTRLRHSNEHCRFPTWSPDGKKIAYNTFVFGSSPKGQTYEIWQVAANGSGSPKQLTTGGDNGRPSWSPGGEYIIYNHGEFLYRINSDGSNPVRLSNTEDGWAPDWIKGASW